MDGKLSQYSGCVPRSRSPRPSNALLISLDTRNLTDQHFLTCGRMATAVCGYADDIWKAQRDLAVEPSRSECLFRVKLRRRLIVRTSLLVPTLQPRQVRSRASGSR